MPNQILYVRHPLNREEEDAYQTFGDMVFYPNGGVRLGGKWFAYQSAIHRHRFGANLIAIRSINDLDALGVETPGGGRLLFRYRPLFRKWYQLVEAHDPRLYLHQQRYGRPAAIGMYYARWALRWAVVQAAALSVILAGYFLLGALIIFIAIAARRWL